MAELSEHVSGMIHGNLLLAKVITKVCLSGDTPQPISVIDPMFIKKLVGNGEVIDKNTFNNLIDLSLFNFFKQISESLFKCFPISFTDEQMIINLLRTEQYSDYILLDSKNPLQVLGFISIEFNKTIEVSSGYPQPAFLQTTTRGKSEPMATTVNYIWNVCNSGVDSQKRPICRTMIQLATKFVYGSPLPYMLHIDVKSTSARKAALCYYESGFRFMTDMGFDQNSNSSLRPHKDGSFPSNVSNLYMIYFEHTVPTDTELYVIWPKPNEPGDSLGALDVKTSAVRFLPRATVLTGGNKRKKSIKKTNCLRKKQKKTRRQ